MGEHAPSRGAGCEGEGRDRWQRKVQTVIGERSEPSAIHAPCVYRIFYLSTKKFEIPIALLSS